MRHLLIVATLFAMTGSSATTQAQSVFYEGALRYSQGKYTLDETVRSAFLLNEITYSSNRWYVEAVIPVIYQDSADVRYAGGMPMPGQGHHGDGASDDGVGHPGHGPGEPGMPPHDFSDLGAGDPYLRVEGLFYRSLFGRNSLGAFGIVKAPVADESQGFGTGEWDLGFGLTWSRRTPDSVLFVELAYWSLGEPPDTSFENPIAVEVVFARALRNPLYMLETSVWGGTETVAGIVGPVAIDLTLRRALHGPHSVYITTEAGLTESAPDFAVIFGYNSRIWTKRPASD